MTPTVAVTRLACAELAADSEQRPREIAERLGADVDEMVVRVASG